MRRSGFLIIVGLAATLVATAAISGRGIVHVRPGSFAAVGPRVLPPGWHLTSPFHRPEVLADEGGGALPPLPVSSREGVRGTAHLSFHYRADPAALSRAASERALGFHSLLERTAAEAMQRVLADRSAADFLDRAALDPPLTAALTRSLGGVGMRVSDLQWEIRLPEDFRRNVLHREYAARVRDTGVRLLLIGLDAADWESIDPLLAAGELPHLKRLIDGGVRGSLRSYNPMISPLLWTTIATGKGPDAHGVADFSVLQAKTGIRIPITARYRKVLTVWNILSEFGRSSAVVGWWASFPADRVEGYLVSDRVAALSLLPEREKLADRAGYTYPGPYLKEILPKLSRPRQVSLEEIRRFADVSPAEYEAGLEWIAHPPAPPQDKKEKPPVQDPVGLLIKILTAARNYQAIALDLLGRGPFDFTAVYFEGIDLVGHRFQHYRPPRMRTVSKAEYRKFGRTVTEYYRYQDRLIGELLQKEGGGVTVLVLSDHGFKTGDRRPEGILPYTMDQPVEWHREEGIFILGGPGARHGRLEGRATLFDIAPTVLALLGLPVATDMPGRLLTSALDADFLRRFPPARIPSYEGVGAAREPEGDTASDEVSAEMMAQLRALGYVGGDTHAAAPADATTGRAPADGAATEDTPVTYHRNLATYLLSHREYEKAISELLNANRREKLPKSYAMLAEAYDALGRRDEAMTALEEGWKAVPQGMASDSILWFVELAAQAGRAERGGEFLAAHRENLKDAPSVRDAAEARLAEAAGRREEAERLYARALAVDPTLVVATKQLLGLYRRENRTPEIRPVLEAGLRRSERMDEYHNLLGALDSEAGRKEEALAHFRRAAELNPGEGRFSLNVGLTLMDLGRWSEAGAIFEEAISASPSPDLCVGLGNVRLRLGDPAGALAAFEKARAQGNGNPRADLGIALSYLSLKRRDDALAFARESLSRDPGNQPLRNLYQDLLRRR